MATEKIDLNIKRIAASLSIYSTYKPLTHPKRKELPRTLASEWHA